MDTECSHPDDPLKPSALLPCPFCGSKGRCGPDGAYYFKHAEVCWVESQRGMMLDCVSGEELKQWNSRCDHEDAGELRAKIDELEDNLSVTIGALRRSSEQSVMFRQLLLRLSYATVSSNSKLWQEIRAALSEGQDD